MHVTTIAMSFGDWFSVCRKGGTEGGGWYIHPKGENSMAVCGFGCEDIAVGLLHKWSWKTNILPHRNSMQYSIKRGKEMFVADVLPRACSKYSEPVMEPQLEF